MTARIYAYVHREEEVRIVWNDDETRTLDLSVGEAEKLLGSLKSAIGHSMED